MRSISWVLVFGFIVGCGGAADEQAPVQPPPPPPAPASSGVADTTPAPAATADAPPPAAKPSMADMQQAALKAAAATFSDAAKFAQLYAPDASVVIAGFPEAKGREAIQKFQQDWIDANSNMTFGVVRTFSKGNILAYELVVTGTDKATGKPWGLDGFDLLTFNDDGLITRDHTYLDVVTMMKQTGAYKGEAPPRAIATQPAGTAEVHASKGDAPEDANVASAKALNDAWLKNDEKTGLAFYADDFVGNNFALWEPKDKKWIKETFAINAKALKDKSRADQTLFGVEDFTIDETESTATQAGAIDHGKVHIPNKHKTVTTHGVTLLQWKDGKVSKAWSWSNGQELDQQLQIRSAAPKPAAKAPAAKKDTTAKPPTK